MAQVIYSERAFRDLDRLVDFLLEAGAPRAQQVVGLITEAIEILANHP